MSTLSHFRGGATPEGLAKLNALTDRVNDLAALRGDEEFVGWERGPGGGLSAINPDAILTRMPRTAGVIGLLFAKVVGVYGFDGGTWVATAGWQAFCAANLCDAAGGNVDTGATVYIGLSASQYGPVGYLDVAADDVIGWFPGDGLAPRYSGSSDILDGHVIPSVGKDGAALIGPLFPVTLTQTGGSAGNSTTVCSFTYTVAYGGVTIKTAAAPLNSRARIVSATAAAGDKGTAYFNGSALVLWDCNETLSQTNC